MDGSLRSTCELVVICGTKDRGQRSGRGTYSPRSFRAPCPVPHAPCPVLCALCYMPCALCPPVFPSFLCPVLSVLHHPCYITCALCYITRALCYIPPSFLVSRALCYVSRLQVHDVSCVVSASLC